MPQISSPQGQIIDKTFYFPIRIYYEDTDAGGIVYYANYLKFAERARTEFLRTIGFGQQSRIVAADKAGFVVRRCEIDYISPAVLDDFLTVSCKVTEWGSASCSMHQEIYRDDKILATIDVKVVYISLTTKRPTRIPPELREKAERF